MKKRIINETKAKSPSKAIKKKKLLRYSKEPINQNGKKAPKDIRDNSFKTIFGDSELFLQFLKNFVNIPILNEIDVADIEDVSERFLPLISENRDGDTIKRIHLANQNSLFVIGILEHQHKVNHRMSFRMLEYIVYVLLDYEKEHRREREHREFKYPPVLPIVFFDGKHRWTAEKNFFHKVYLNGVFEKYIPKFEYLLVNLSEYSQEDLVNKDGALSLILMFDKLTEQEGIASLKNLPADYLKNLQEKTPENLLEIMRNIVDLLMVRINVPDDERKEMTDMILERRISDMFAWADNLDIQAERKKVEEQRKIAEESRQRAEAAEAGAEAERKISEAARIRIKELEAQLAEAVKK